MEERREERRKLRESGTGSDESSREKRKIAVQWFDNN